MHALIPRLTGRMANTRLWARSLRWPAYSHLVAVSDDPRWVLSWEAHEVGNVARSLGIPVVETSYFPRVCRQAVFFASQFVLTKPDLGAARNRVGIAYFHGRPDPHDPQSWAVYQGLRRHHAVLHRVQVSHAAMREVVLESGVRPDRVFLIPIGINLDYFPPVTAERRRRAREQLGIPASALVIGSFQKDGVGWGDGAEPKLVKGPDVFLRTLEYLKPHCPNLFVLLSGPARGYVKAGLHRLGLPYVHRYVQHYPEIATLYHALDLYLVTSRDEGGPKAVLESMATGIPLVSTRVGQAADIVRTGWNGWLVDAEDAEGLAHSTLQALQHPSILASVLVNAQATAEQHTYESQKDLWHAFLRGFVEGV